MAMLKIKLTIDAFRAIQSMLRPIPALRIVQIDEGSPTRKPDDLLEEPLIPPPYKFFFTESSQQIISFISGTSENPQDKGK